MYCLHRKVTPAHAITALALAVASMTAVQAQSLTGIANREVARRLARIEDARVAMEKGDELFADGDYEASLGQYQAALSSIPDAPLAKDWKSLAEAKFADCSVTVAREKAKDGRYEEAKDLVEGALVVIPDHAEAKRFEKHLADPDSWPPALTPQHVENVKEVQKTLWLGHSAYEIGDYDASISHYQDVLRIDPYNSAARRGMEKVEMKKSEYFDTARDQQRARMLNQVNEAWEDKVPTKALVMQQEFGSGRREGAYLTEKMNQIIFPTVQFAGATIEEAIEYLRVKSRDLDEYEPDPSKKGVNIILRTGDTPVSAQISLDLKDVPMVEALRYITELAGMKYKVESFAVLVVPLSDTNAEQNTRMYKVPPDFLSMGGGSASAAPAASADPFASTGSASTGSALIQRQTALEILSSQGIPFPDGASAVFNPVTSQLIVKNTQPNLDLVETFVSSLINQAPKQISIAAKFVEVSQRNTDELGFDWFLGSVGVNANNVFLGGGTAGNSPASGVGFPTFPGGFGTGAGNPLSNISRGVRSGGTAVSSDSVDGAIAAAVAGTTSIGGGSNLAPGIFSVAGIFTDPQFATIVRGLSQQKGTDLMSAPSVTTKSGQRATVQVVREFIYPTEFDPPQLPQGNAGGIAGGTTSLIATPTTPTAFEMRPVGVTMEVDPVVGADGYTIDLNLAPEVVEFDGFINYGSPILAPSALPGPATVITQNVINQPVFSVRKVQTSVTVWDGQTVALGGLIREDVEDVEDGIPLLQDLPFVGRLFQSKTEDHFKRNLMIFVTAKLIDPSGQPIRIQSTQDSSSTNPLLPAIGAP